MSPVEVIVIKLLSFPSTIQEVTFSFALTVPNAIIPLVIKLLTDGVITGGISSKSLIKISISFSSESPKVSVDFTFKIYLSIVSKSGEFLKRKTPDSESISKNSDPDKMEYVGGSL